MSLIAPQTKEEGKFQYCSYGYDKTKFKSFDDCMTNYNKVFYPPKTTDLPVSVKPTTDEVKKQNLNLASRVDVMTQEDKFYEMFGIKKSRSGDIGIQSRPLGRLLVAVVLVGGYFAYKKFKK
jgi:hypothetical protein